MMNPHHLLAGLATLWLATSCYTDLEDEDDYRELRINDQARIPNLPPRPRTTSSGTNAPPDDDGSGGTPPVDEPPTDGQTIEDLVPASCGDVPSMIFGASNKCGGAACHGSPGTPAVAYADLGSSPNDAHTRLLDVEGTGACAGKFIIDTANPDESLLITKLSSPAACGLPMPVGPALTAEEIQCVTDWTRAAAQLANQ